jgi:hypothetical protein
MSANKTTTDDYSIMYDYQQVTRENMLNTGMASNFSLKFFQLIRKFSVADPVSFDPWIRDPGLVKNQDPDQG